MKRDTNLFAEDLKVEVSGEEIPYDTSHIYTGELYGNIYKDFFCSGSVVPGFSRRTHSTVVLVSQVRKEP